VEGEAKITNYLLDQISFPDIQRMVGEYMVNFLIASVLEQTRKPSSRESQT
jgi:hypothetical protein